MVNEVLRSPGQPLDAPTRTAMEIRFGHNFSKVRVHTNPKAAESARSVHAQAYTVGRQMVFGEGRYAPATSEGRCLLAHELVHTIQQQNLAHSLVSPLRVSDPSDSEEKEADRLATGLTEGEPPRVTGASRVLLQPQPLSNPGKVSLGDSLLENASPLLAAALGSAVLDHFDTGKTELKAEHKGQLANVSTIPFKFYCISTMLRQSQL